MAYSGPSTIAYNCMAILASRHYDTLLVEVSKCCAVLSVTSTDRCLLLTVLVKLHVH